MDICTILNEESRNKMKDCGESYHEISEIFGRFCLSTVPLEEYRGTASIRVSDMEPKDWKTSKTKVVKFYKEQNVDFKVRIDSVMSLMTEFQALYDIVHAKRTYSQIDYKNELGLESNEVGAFKTFSKAYKKFSLCLKDCCLYDFALFESLKPKLSKHACNGPSSHINDQ